jgi:ATP-dependent DNA helicase RecG
MGTRAALGRHLAQSEVVYEYRSNEASIPYQQREEHRQGFFLSNERPWELVDLRNEEQQYQDRFFVGSISALNETVVREAILNAVSHRDYRLGGSTFIRQYPRKLEIVSPGGFPVGVTAENILWRQSPRNRRIAETFGRCGLVERSGQGANRMFEESIKESKRKPDFSGTDQYQVALTLWGEVQDPRFLAFLGKIGRETLASFTTHDLLVLDLVHREQAIPPELRDRLPNLRERGIIEMQGRGKGVRYLLSRSYYSFVGRKGTYTRKIGLDKETNKALLLRHI